MKYLTKSILKLPERKKTAHKGTYGYVLVIGGCEDYAGAPYLAAHSSLAVLRSGADLVSVAAPETTAWAINCMDPNIITKKFKGKYFTLKHAKQALNYAKKFDVILIGPGIGNKSNKFIQEIARINKPKVIDAEGIKAINLAHVDNAIITPHKKEFEILLKNSKIKEPELKRKLKNNVILLKGPVDKIISKNKTAYNKTGNPVMTKAGTGDVLAGLCAGFLAQTGNLFKSACMAAYLNGKVGDYLLKKKGRTFIASDLVENMHRVLR